MTSNKKRGVLRYGSDGEPAQPRHLYDKSWAIVVGINYEGSEHPHLKNACNDAEAIAKILKEDYAFDHVTVLRDEEATAEAMLSWLRDELPNKTGPNDRVVLFFAGHGASQESRQGVTRGYLVPHGARKNYADYIDMSELHKACTQITAKHILIILDCCFSGVNAVAARAAPSAPNSVDDAYLKRVIGRTAWQILTAGDSDDLAADSGTRPGHSAFTSALLEGLEGGADQNKDGYITASELANYVTPEVTRQTDGGQSPFFRYLSGSQQGGDFIFAHPERIIGPQPIAREVERPADRLREKPDRATKGPSKIIQKPETRQGNLPSRLRDLLRDPIFQGIGAVIAVLALLVAIVPMIWSGITPTPTPVASPALPGNVPVNFSFEVKDRDTGKFAEGIEGGEYHSGQELRLRFTPVSDGYAYLFSLDTAGKFTPMWPDYTSREAAPVRAGVEYATNLFRLDQNEGQEQFFAIASSEPFSYTKDIEPYLKPQPLPGGKGVDPVLKRLELPEERFAQKRITFAHISPPVDTIPTDEPITATLTPGPKLGDTWTRPTDGMVMVYVPAGAFQMGSENGASDEEPVHAVNLDAFWLDRTEMTNAQYRLCIDAGVCGRSSLAGDSTYNGDAYPAVGVDWNNAQSYCQWAGARLPTEAEWEYAARGPEGRVYPWGDTFDGTKLNFCDENCEYSTADKSVDDGYAQTSPVGSYPDGASWIGALDMAGNVWEWVADWYGTYLPGRQVNPTGPSSGEGKALRGGSWNLISLRARGATRIQFPPDYGYEDVGFRCARNP